MNYNINTNISTAFVFISLISQKCKESMLRNGIRDIHTYVRT